MTRLIRTLAFALPLIAASAATAAAQQITNPPELAADAPTAKQARAIAELLLAGDRKKVDAWLAANGAPSFTGSATFASDVTELIEALKTGPRTILRFDDAGPTRVGVVLARAAGGDPERALVVAIDPAAPHRVTALRLARIQIG